MPEQPRLAEVLSDVKEAETLNTDKPAQKFAPLKSIELVIGGPKDEVAALKKGEPFQEFQLETAKI